MNELAESIAAETAADYAIAALWGILGIGSSDEIDQALMRGFHRAHAALCDADHELDYYRGQP